MSFEVIETQEKLDAIIKERLARQKEQYEGKLTDYENLKTELDKLQQENASYKSMLDEAKEKAGLSEKSIEELNAKVSGYEKAQLRTKIALANGLPMELADRLAGESEDDLTADAKRLAEFMVKREQAPPLKDVEEPELNSSESAFRSMLKGLNQK